MNEKVKSAIASVQSNEINFVKFLTANDSGKNGSHQVGVYIPKNSASMLFEEIPQKGENAERFVNIVWEDDIGFEGRFIYYGKSKNEFRITNFNGRKLPFDHLFVLTKQDFNTYSAFVLNPEEADYFLKYHNLKRSDTNKILELNNNANEEVQMELFESFETKSEEDEVKSKHFRPKAHILTLLGEELIKNPVMAIYELVKNSYDADANKVDVYFRNVDDVDKASIIVQDDGVGMDSDVIENVWLEPGSDNRKPIDPLTGLRRIVKSAIYGRVPMGEKGVGRFAVHKLGSTILLITRPKIFTRNKESGEVEKIELANYEIELFINWKDFSQSKHLTDIPITWRIRREQGKFRFKDSSGTYIRVSGLKEPWTRAMARELKGHTLSMLSPKVTEENFKIKLNFENEWLLDFPTAEKIIDSAPYKITAFVDSEFNLDFEYEFFLQNNDSIGSRKIKDDKRYNQNIKGRIRGKFEEYLKERGYSEELILRQLEKFDLNNLIFGNLIFEFYSFDLDVRSMRDYTSNSKTLKDILKQHAGIKVFKGDMRVYDYGEPGNDWLGLDLKRIQNKTWFSNNQNIGYVFLDPEDSTCLVEKTNREGFINDESYHLFYTVLVEILSEFKATRLVDRENWLRFNQKSTNQLFDKKISNFRSIIEKIELTDDKKESLLNEAKKLEDKYEEDKKSLLIPAGVGMTASVALHEIEKLVPRMEQTVSVTPVPSNEIREEVKELRQYTEGILSVLRKGGGKPFDVVQAVKRSFNNYDTRLSDRQISFKVDAQDVSTLNCDKRYFITMVMNIVDNSIYWLSTTYQEDKKIYVKIFKDDGGIHIIIVDNGPGFKDDITDLVRPFFTRKSDGIGIGMYLIDTIMMQYGKLSIHTDINELIQLGIPEDYNGAAIELTFNKNQN